MRSIAPLRSTTHFSISKLPTPQPKHRNYVKWNGRLGHVAILLAAALFVEVNTLWNGFVWDDNIIVVGNTVYKDFDLYRIFFSLTNGLEYLPVRDISFSLDFLLWGWNPQGFHLTNIALYCLTVVSVYFLAAEIEALFSTEKISKNFGNIPLITALLFAVHPIHSEVTSFIISRGALLSGLFFFTSCYLYLCSLQVRENNILYFASLACFIFALFSKATAITLPLLLIAFLYFDKNQKSYKDYLWLGAFFVISFTGYIVFKNVGSQSNMINENILSFGSLDFASKLAVAVQIPFFYIGKLLFPFKLSVEYDIVFIKSLIGFNVLLQLIILLLLFFMTVTLRRKHPQLLFGYTWLLFTLIPVLNFFPTHPVVADRYVYLSSFAFFYLFALIFSSITYVALRKITISLFLSTIFFWSFLAINRNLVWESDKSLWENTIKVSPASGKAHTNLGGYYFNNNDYEKAFALFKKAEELIPNNSEYDYYRGLFYFNSGDLVNAISCLKEALNKNGNSLEAAYLIANAYERVNDLENAIASYNKLLLIEKIDPMGKYKVPAKTNLQHLWSIVDPQLEPLRKKIILNPSDIDSLFQLAITLDKQGRYEESLRNYRKLEMLGNGSWQLFYNIANVLKKLGKYQDAATSYETSLALKPDYADTHNNLGLVYRKLGKYTEAINAFEQAMALDEDYAFAPFNLGVTYFRMGNKKLSVRYFNLVDSKFPQLRFETKYYFRELRS